MHKRELSAMLMLLVQVFVRVRAHVGHSFKDEKKENDTRSCTDKHIDLDLVDSKYVQHAAPGSNYVELCLKHMNIVEKVKKRIPHVCASRVFIAITFTELQEFDVSKHIIAFKMTYYETWKDKRLILPAIMNSLCNNSETVRSTMYLEPVDYYRRVIWTPDLYIKGVLQIRMIRAIKAFESLILRSNHAVQNTVTLNTIMICPMNFESFPFDTQVCNVTVESFGHFHYQMALVWSSVGVHVLPEFSLLGYEVTVKKHEPSVVLYKPYTFPQLKVSLIFRRLREKYIFLIYGPSVLHFIIAWLAIFLPKEVAQGRCIINCSCTLSLVSMLSVYSRISPHGGYVKSLDVWSYCSILFQFLCLFDALIDTRLLYAASNIKHNPLEAGNRHVWNLVTNEHNWLGKEVKLIRSQDEGKNFDETVRDIRRMLLVTGSTKASRKANADTKREVKSKMQELMFAKYRFSPRYFRFLRLLVLYQEWSQYILLFWYIIFILGYSIIYVPHS